MKELKDIILNKGDIIEFEAGYKFMLNKDNYTKVELERYNRDYGDVIKIERVVEWETLPKELNPLPVRAVRPIKYETIYEASKQILDKEEKEYLEAVIRPFKDRVIGVHKGVMCTKGKEWIFIDIKDDDPIDLPYFDIGTMYKGMKSNKKYTLDELGLFKE